MVKDMTSGSPVRLLVGFAVPMIIGNVFQQFYGMVDAIVVGRFVNVQALAAIGATGSLNFLILGFVLGLAAGFSVIISQRFGAGDEDGVRRATAMSLLLSLAVTVIMTALSMSLTRPLLIAMQTPEDILDDACDYLLVIFAGTFAILLFNLLSAILRALGDSKTPLYILVLCSLINVGLDLLFVLKFQMGVVGTAYATVIAQAVSCAACIVFIMFRFPILHLKKEHWRWDKALCLQLLRIGVPTGASSSVTAIGFVVLQGFINSLGSNIVAAFTAGSRVEQLMLQPAYSFGAAAAAFSGQNMGARQLERIRMGVRKALQICVALCVVCGLAMIFLGNFMIQIFISEQETEVIYYAQYYLTIAGTFLPILALLNIYRNAIQGLGNGIIPLLSGVVELAMRVGVALLLTAPLGYLGVCLASPAAWAGATVLLIIFYYRIMKNLRSDPSLLHG